MCVCVQFAVGLQWLDTISFPLRWCVKLVCKIHSTQWLLCSCVVTHCIVLLSHVAMVDSITTVFKIFKIRGDTTQFISPSIIISSWLAVVVEIKICQWLANFQVQSFFFTAEIVNSLGRPCTIQQTLGGNYNYMIYILN